MAARESACRHEESIGSSEELSRNVSIYMRYAVIRHNLPERKTTRTPSPSVELNRKLHDRSNTRFRHKPNFSLQSEMESDENSSMDSKFYTDAAKYWERIPATVDGMLGGFGFISATDIAGSTRFLKNLFESRDPPAKMCALDCGAGIGRITKNLLVHHFKRVDLVEQNPKFLEAAKKSLHCYASRIGEYYAVGLQDFSPPPETYDVIWCQWVLGHLRDDHLVDFFKRCSSGLKKNGVLVVKENVTSSNDLEIDTKDSSMTRPLSGLKNLFEEAELICLNEERQRNFPREVYPVYMFVLKPQSSRPPEMNSMSE